MIDRPILWKGIAIAQLTNDQLREALGVVTVMSENYNKVVASDAYKKKFGNRPLPNPNPNFVNLINAINKEVANRKWS